MSGVRIVRAKRVLAAVAIWGFCQLVRLRDSNKHANVLFLNNLLKIQNQRTRKRTRIACR